MNHGISQVVKGLNLARSGVYFLESIPFAIVGRLMAKADVPPPTPEQIRSLWAGISELHEWDRAHIEAGTYPLNTVEIENPIQHARSFAGVLRDGVRVAWRMRQNKTKDLPADSTEGVPEYYARNFHFQTDGYFSEASARRYDHQVEILFSGTASTMRRIVLPILAHAPAGKWLELGCGAGSATSGVLKTYPGAHVTAVDLSEPYLKVAQDQLRSLKGVDFMRADSTNLPFKDETFEAVYSMYMLHEMPRKTREAVVREAYRVLKPGGLLVFADSLQWNDNEELNWALERFPKIYHEPFYKDYSRDQLADLIKRATGQYATNEYAFLTKASWLLKP